MTRKELKNILLLEKGIYSEYMFPTFKRYFLAWLKNEPAMLIWKWQRMSRIVDYYHLRIESGASTIFDKIMYLLYSSLFRKKSALLGFEISTEKIGPGLQIYHYSGGVVVNGDAVIGRGCHFHGNNCIGNSGPNNLSCPIIGDNVMLGVGAKIIGNVRIANGVKIAAGAVVIHDVLEENCTVAGIPAVVVKHERSR